MTPRFDAHMRHSLALLASSVLAFCTTLVLSLLSYRFIEGPIMNLNRHVQYGAEARPFADIPRGSRQRRRLALLAHDCSTFHHEADVLHHADIVEWVAGNGDDIRIVAGL